jgi:hypothetical protein
MRIAKATLIRVWAWSSGLAIGIFAVLTLLDYRLKALSGVNTADLSGFSSWAQFQLAFRVWAPERFAARAGFNLGFAYLLMPLYAVSFFASGIIAAEGLTPKSSSLRRVIMAAIWVPVIGALADAGVSALYLAMLANGPSEAVAALAASLSRIKTIALLIGLALFVGAAMAWFQARRLTRSAR